MMHADSFEQLVGNYYAALYRFALSLARNSHDACDLTQQTFCIWAEKGHALREKNRAKTWLFTTLYREFLRVQRRSGRVSAIADLPAADQDFCETEVDLVAKMDAPLVMKALQEVDLVFREALTLYYLQSLSYLEIAAVLAIPMGTVTSRISRGKRQLRRLLQAKDERAAAFEFVSGASR